MKKILICFSTAILFSLLSLDTAYAGVSCQSVYGGGTCEGDITIHTQVLQPNTTNTYVDNLDTHAPHYQPSSPIFFKITVKNVSTNILHTITISDIIDNSNTVEFTNGPGTFDSVSKTLTYTIDTLQPGEENTVVIAGRIVPAQKLPVNQLLVCPLHVAQAKYTSQVTQSTTEFCIQNQTAPTTTPLQSQTKGGNTFPIFTPTPTLTTSPKSGPELLSLLGLIPAGGAGLWLKKKAKNI